MFTLSRSWLVARELVARELVARELVTRDHRRGCRRLPRDVGATSQE
jgi:hypothetical protein